MKRQVVYQASYYSIKSVMPRRWANNRYRSIKKLYQQEVAKDKENKKQYGISSYQNTDLILCNKY